MGVIQRQGIKQSLVTYFGVILGAVNVLLIYTTTLEPDEYGFIQVMTSASKLCLPFVLLGSQSMIVRFFPKFENQEKGHYGYLSLMLLVPTVGILLLALLNWIFQPNLIASFFRSTDLVETYGGLIIPWLLFLAYSQVFTRYEMNFHRIAVPAVFNDLFVKLGIPAACIAYYVGWIDFRTTIWCIVILHGLILAAHVIYTRKLGQLFFKPIFERLNPRLLKEMGTYAGFGILGNLGSAIVPHIDTFMVGSLVGLSSAAIYTIPNFVTNAIDIPRRALANIAAPIITKAWEENNFDELQGLYKKSSINQFVVGLFMLLGIWLSIHDLYRLIPEGSNREVYEAGKYVVLILGSSKVLDMLTGINSEIIMYSRYFRVNFYAIIVLAGVSIVLNLWLIPKYGINGAALATLISFAVFNLVKFLYLYFKVGLQPFTAKTLVVAAIGAITYLIAWYLPEVGHPIFNILLRSSVFALLYILLTWQLRPSEELGALADQWWKKLRGR